eukprot:CAMPEP_0197521102 /NCGR_PEP_ID=MMETSP1318-20131121/6362_1 /TAXON_ID=552666 /ORGANISM="Partenskyella glossopodia, Strain RCC365" /LENGTH=295 /DNA_ID=CAMNT_0043072929 /DNA_START=334 /DNA_END=1221 /DNA_ORIENTATION=-
MRSNEFEASPQTSAAAASATMLRKSTCLTNERMRDSASAASSSDSRTSSDAESTLPSSLALRTDAEGFGVRVHQARHERDEAVRGVVGSVASEVHGDVSLGFGVDAGLGRYLVEYRSYNWYSNVLEEGGVDARRLDSVGDARLSDEDDRSAQRLRHRSVAHAADRPHGGVAYAVYYDDFLPLFEAGDRFCDILQHLCTGFCLFGEEAAREAPEEHDGPDRNGRDAVVRQNLLMSVGFSHWVAGLMYAKSAGLYSSDISSAPSRPRQTLDFPTWDLSPDIIRTTGPSFLSSSNLSR